MIVFEVKYQQFIRLSTLIPDVGRTSVDALRAYFGTIRDRIRAEKLSGDPLKRVSGLLSNSLYAKVNRIPEGTTVTIGEPASVPYAAIHEFGGTFAIKKYVQRYHYTKQYLSKFSGGKRTDVTTGRRLHPYRDIGINAHSKTFPERSYIRSFISENEDQIISGVAVIIGNKVNQWVDSLPQTS